MKFFNIVLVFLVVLSTNSSIAAERVNNLSCKLSMNDLNKLKKDQLVVVMNYELNKYIGTYTFEHEIGIYNPDTKESSLIITHDRISFTRGKNNSLNFSLSVSASNGHTLVLEGNAKWRYTGHFVYTNQDDKTCTIKITFKKNTVLFNESENLACSRRYGDNIAGIGNLTFSKEKAK